MRFEQNWKIRKRTFAFAVAFALSAVLILFLAAGVQPVFAAESEPKEQLQEILNPETEDVPATPEDSTEYGDILVVSDEEQDAYTEDTLGVLGYELTALGYRADYTTSRGYSEDPQFFDETYERIIWVTSAEQTSEKNQLRCPDEAYGGRLLVLGAMPEELAVQKNLGDGEVNRGEVPGTASYTLKGSNVFTSLIILDVSRLYKTADYTSGTWETASGTYPLTVGWGTLRNLVIRDYQSDFAKAVLMEEITLWLWPYQDAPHSYSSCLVLDEIYPYTDPERLLALVKKLESRNMNYVLSVMPLYQHADYPGMSQFCEVLRYAQDHGGAVILHSPIIQNGVETEELQESLTAAFESYIENGVYPVALSVPSAWIFNDDLHDTLGRYRTLFLEDTDAFSEQDTSALSSAGSRLLSLGAQVFTPAIPLDDTGVSYLDTCATAVYVSMETDDEKVDRIIDAADASPVSMESLWDMDQAVYTNRSHSLTWDRKNLIVDGELVSLTYEPKAYNDDFEYKRNVYYRAIADLSNENVLLIFFSLVVIIAFVSMILIARKQMRRQFLYKKLGRTSDADDSPRGGTEDCGTGEKSSNKDGEGKDG
ncbi:MAG: DUF2334 domain-containing protein [Lachnospiraceae bacterium]